MIGDETATLRVELRRGEPLPGTEEQFESALRDATVGRLSLREPVRADIVLPYALEARVADPLDTGPPVVADPLDAVPLDTGPVDTGPVDTGPVDTGPVDPEPGVPGRPHQWAVVVRNGPDAPAPYVRVAVSGVTPAHRLPSADGELTLELHPGEYFIELRRGSSWAEVEHPVALNRVSYFGERQAAGRAG